MKKLIALFSLLFGLQAQAVTSKEAYKLSQEGKAVLVDVREESEIKEGMVKDALWFPMSKIEKDANWKKEFAEKTKNKKVFLYCRSGNRSGKVKSILAKEGIQSENIGGMLTLKDELPTMKP